MATFAFTQLPDTSTPTGIRLAYTASGSNTFVREFGLRQWRAFYNTSATAVEHDLYLFYIYDPLLTTGRIDCEDDTITIDGATVSGNNVTAQQVAALLRAAKVI
jgi:hypothetical protein